MTFDIKKAQTAVQVQNSLHVYSLVNIKTVNPDTRVTTVLTQHAISMQSWTLGIDYHLYNCLIEQQIVLYTKHHFVSGGSACNVFHYLISI